MRGVSTRNGTATAAAPTRTTSVATTPSSHFTQRGIARSSLRSGGLDSRQLPGVRADGSRERPELLEPLGRGARPGHDAAARVRRVVDEAAGQQHGHEVLPALLPRLGHLGSLDLHALDVIGAPGAAKPLTL